MDTNKNFKNEFIKPKKNKKKKFTLFIIVIITFIYIPALIMWIFNDAIVTDIIKIGNFEDSISSQGYIIREELILRKPFEGKVITEIIEGEKVQAFSKVATFLRGNTEKLFEQLGSIENQIYEVQKSNSSNKEIFGRDVEGINEEIDRETDNLIKSINNNTFSDLNIIEREIQMLLKKKSAIIGKNVIPDSKLIQLNKEKARIDEELNRNTKTITAPFSGTISYILDGYENKLTPEIIPRLTPTFLESLTANTDNNDKISNEAEKPFAKLVRNMEYYIVLSINKDKLGNLKLNDNVKIRINDINKTIAGQINYISSEIESKRIITIKTDIALSDTVALRKVNLEIITSTLSGFVVPLKSLIDFDKKNMKAKVAIVKASIVKFFDVKVIGRNGDYVVIEQSTDFDKKEINLYDIYVVTSKNIKEGQVIK